jgi:hypothetical protein
MNSITPNTETALNKTINLLLNQSSCCPCSSVRKEPMKDARRIIPSQSTWFDFSFRHILDFLQSLESKGCDDP